jgi:ATP-dependent helicase/nuclease subunit A
MVENLAQQVLPEESPQSVRPLDPNVLQRRAANPDSSVWVSASAGTGKTKVLTDRVLRLLLPRSTEEAGTPPHKILCLTFTKAGANEMALRINKVLGEWAVMPAEELEKALTSLLGRSPRDDEKREARRLFAAVVDIPGGLKIMTIHSFCQSVLSRFPLEAGLSPGFEALEESQETPLLAEARKQLFESDEAAVEEALFRLTPYNNEDQFTQILRQLAGERYRLKALLAEHDGAEGVYKTLCTSLGVRADETPESIIEAACSDAVMDSANLRRACSVLTQSSSKGDVEKGEKMARFLSASPSERPALFEDYTRAFLKQDGEPYATLATKKTAAEMEDILEVMGREALRLQEVKERVNAALCAGLTRDILFLGNEILQRYQSLKQSRGALDFDDMINATLGLLEGVQNIDWVMYKLDQGLDHILVDEAQDTNPEQWRIIESLAAEFFSGDNARENITRTLFVVGDEKQSIYSFQRAAPEEFTRMKTAFAEKIEAAKSTFDPVDLNISFRTVQSVLGAVDAVFVAMGTTHDSFRTRTHGHGGHVELWPLFEAEKTDQMDFWAPPIEAEESTSAASMTAEFIASQIAGWLENGEILESSGKPITAGDIMILMRSRSAFVTQLTRALKQKNIPVSGADRMVLSSQLPVQDMLSLCGFALLPADDLTLACVLKSPFIGWDDDRLYALAQPRTGTLWQALLEAGENDDNIAAIATYLRGLSDEAITLSPYEFLASLLHRPCPAHEHSGLQGILQRLGADALDPLDEFLNTALEFGRHNTADLQEFLQYFAEAENQIKREMEEGGDAVRIMTVHGAKGLQAPVVILPDTVLAGNARRPERLIWPLSGDKQTEQSLPLYVPNKESSCAAYRDALEAYKARNDAEYQRLLYVAMTRAEDCLYVTGYKGGMNPLPQSWYFMVQEGLERLSGESGYSVTQDGFIRYANPQIRDVDAHQEESTNVPPSQETPPAWLFEQAPKEEAAPRAFSPSHLTGTGDGAEQEPPAASPLSRDDLYRFRRGNITHKLLQFLPDITHTIPVGLLEETARDFVRRHGHDLSEDIHEGIVREVMAILNHPEFAPLFGENSIAEAPLSGKLSDGRLVNGQIDRLLITDQTVYIVDYKTNRPPPTDESDIPAAYQRQMQAYYDILHAIHPDKDIRCALLWTDGPRLMEISALKTH